MLILHFWVKCNLHFIKVEAEQQAVSNYHIIKCLLGREWKRELLHAFRDWVMQWQIKLQLFISERLQGTYSGFEEIPLSCQYSFSWKLKQSFHCPSRLHGNGFCSFGFRNGNQSIYSSQWLWKPQFPMLIFANGKHHQYNSYLIITVDEFHLFKFTKELALGMIIKCQMHL